MNEKNKELLIDTINDMLGLWKTEGEAYKLLGVNLNETPMSTIAYKNFERIIDLIFDEKWTKDLIQDFVYTVLQEFNEEYPFIIYEGTDEDNQVEVHITNTEELVEWIWKQIIIEEESKK